MKSFKHLLVALAVIIGMAAATPAAAFESDLRLGFGSFMLRYKDQAQVYNSSGGGYQIGYVARFGDYAAIEGRYGSANKSSKAGLTLQGESFMSLLAEPTLPLSEKVSVYGMLGVSRLAVERTAANGAKQTVNRTATSYGFGGDYRLSDLVTFSGEWLIYGKNVDFGPQGGASWPGVSRARVSFDGLTFNFNFGF